MDWLKLAQRIINPSEQDIAGIGVAAPSELATADHSMIGKTLVYFKFYFPIVISFVIGSGILGIIYMLYDYVKQEIEKKLYSSVTIVKREESFNWINVFIKDNGWIKGDGSLTCRIKGDNLEWWEAIFKAKDDKAKPQLEYLTGPGTYVCNFKNTTIWAV